MRNPFLPQPARIVRKFDLTDDVRFFQIRLKERDQVLSFDYKPGQFVIFSLPGTGEAPFSLSSTPSRPGLLEFGIRKVGRLTEALFRLNENDEIGIRGPYGNGFPVEQMTGSNLLIVMGGLGAVPLRSLLLYALDNRELFGGLHLLYGSKRPEDMLYRKEFFEFIPREDIDCLLTVEEDRTGNWPCNRGFVTELFSKIKNLEPQNTYASVCGPPVMYKFVMEHLVALNIPKHQILMTLERRMKCGIGKCGHCVIEDIYTCMDGPIFTYWDVLHMKELI
jgi:sulfhydrogenase subunit gamma (sulfur reductase)